MVVIEISKSDLLQLIGKELTDDEIEETLFLIKIESKITEKTKALINIDLGGNPSEYKELLRISKEYDFPLIVDGAQSFGSEYHGKKCCTHGMINTTSFHSAKILTTIEGGMVFTNNPKICMKAKSIRNQGEEAKYIHQFLGNNYRMIDLLAALGSSQLDRFEETVQKRIQFLRRNEHKRKIRKQDWTESHWIKEARKKILANLKLPS